MAAEREGPVSGFLDSIAVMAGIKYFPMGNIFHLAFYVAL